MKLNKSNFLFLLFLVLFLSLSLNSFTIANDIQKRGLEIKYPIINGIEITTSSSIGTYAVYLFSFSMIIGAILAFVILIFGGFRYVTSVGNPSAMADARKWIWEAILGLILLLCAWLIIGIINQELLTPKVPDIEAISGIYLVGKDKTKIPYSQDVVNRIPDYFEVDYIEFISDPPEDIAYANPDKKELCSVYVYDEENLEGEAREEIRNTGAGTKHYISNIGSMFLLWHKPGVYLYKEEGYDQQFNNPPRPKFIQTSQTIFKEDFDNKIKSIKIVNDLSSKSSLLGKYYVILFEEPNFNKDSKGKCDLEFFSTEDFSSSEVKNNISSIAVFKNAKLHGEVKFYDEINQKGNESSPPFTAENATPILLSDSELDVWNSIAINGNITVILYTKEDHSHLQGRGYCRLFSPLSHDGDNLKTTSIYHRCYDLPGSLGCEEYLPRHALIIPRQE